MNKVMVIHKNAIALSVLLAETICQGCIYSYNYAASVSIIWENYQTIPQFSAKEKKEMGECRGPVSKEWKLDSH